MANYDIAEHWQDLSQGKRAQVINLASKEKLRQWASDPDCNQKLLCTMALAGEDVRPLLDVTTPKNEQSLGISKPTPTNAQLAQMLFDPRSDVSADAKHIVSAVERSGRRIVMHLWILFVALPVVLGILYAILTAK